VVVIISKLHPWIRCTFQTSLQFINTYRLQTKVISELNSIWIQCCYYDIFNDNIGN